MPSNTQPDPEQHKGDANNDEEDQRDTIPDGRVRPDADGDDEELVVERHDEEQEEDATDEDDDVEEIDIDQLPEAEGPDA
jgi:hypothetical protein